MSLSRWLRRLRGVPDPEGLEDAPSELLPPDPGVLPAPARSWGPTEDAHDASLLPTLGGPDEALEVYADALMAAGDLRGEHVALMLRGQDKHAAALRKHHRAHFYGPVAAWKLKAMNQLADLRPKNTPRFGRPERPSPVPLRVYWRAGFIDALRIDVTPERVEPLLAFLRHPSCARLRILVLGGTRMHDLGEKLTAAPPLPTIERLHIGDFTMAEFNQQEADQGAWLELDRVFPNLRHLAANGVAELGGLAAVETLQIQREEAFARVQWPAPGVFARLRLAWLCGAQAEALLDRGDMTQLTDLRVGREITKSFAQTLAKRATGFPNLQVLGFQRCDMRHAARPLETLVPRLPELRTLIVPRADTAYHDTLSQAFPGRIAVAPPEMRYAHFFREIDEPAPGVLEFDDLE